MKIDEFAETLRTFLACSDFIDGVTLKKIHDDEYAIPVLTSDGEKYGIIIEKIDDKN